MPLFLSFIVEIVDCLMAVHLLDLDMIFLYMRLVFFSSYFHSVCEISIYSLSVHLILHIYTISNVVSCDSQHI